MNEDMSPNQQSNINCQAPLNTNPVPSSAINTPLPFHRKKIFIVLTLIFLPPLGILFMWLWSHWKVSVKILFTVLLIPMTLTALMFWLVCVAVVQRVIVGGNSDSRIIQQVGFDKKRDLASEKEKMLHFLQTKYGKEFTFKNGKFEDTASLGFRFTTFIAEVSPVDDPNVSIRCSRLTSGLSLDRKSTDPDYKNYGDNYPEMLWTKQESESTNQFLISKYGYLPQHEVKVSMLGGINRDQYLNTTKGAPLVLADLPKDVKSRLSYIIHLDIEGEVLKSNIIDHAQSIVDINNYALSRGMGDVMITYIVLDSSMNRNIQYEWQGVGNHRARGLTKAIDAVPYFTRSGVGKYVQYYNSSKGKYEVSATPFISKP